MKTPTILWADDDADDILLFTQILQEMNQNYLIVEAENGQEALYNLEQMKQNNTLPCLIILDINMPILSGKDTLARIKSDPALEEVPVAVFTTSSSRLDSLFCERYGVKHFIKPPVYLDLKVAVQNILTVVPALTT